MADLGIENAEIHTASGVTLNETEKVLACSILDVMSRFGGIKDVIWRLLLAICRTSVP